MLFKRVADLEAKVAFLLRHFNLADQEQAERATLLPTQYPDVRDQLLNGNKIGAIAAYRQHTGTSLADAKAAVEVMEQQLRGQ